MAFESEALRWLQQLISERVSDAIRLQVREGPEPGYRLSLEGKSIEIPAWDWQMGNAVDTCCEFDAVAEGWAAPLEAPLPAPGARRLKRPLIESSVEGCVIHYDILGFSRWVLSRAEEVGRSDLDTHGRFPATASHAYRNGYLERPIVDEWFDVLRQVVRRLWPNLNLIDPRFSQRVSHDVDQPSAYAFRGVMQVVRSLGADLFMRLDLATALRRPWVWLLSKRRLQSADPFNTFRWIMDVSERNELQSTFYFVCGQAHHELDPLYDIDDPAIRRLIRDICMRGHNIGLHPSYVSGDEPDGITREARRLLAACAEENIEQSLWGARMHYLRFKNPSTLYALQAAGVDYDHSLGYADLPGFRCGTCHEYTAFDPVARSALKLRVLPLVVMDIAVTDPAYLGLGTSTAALNRFVHLKNICRRVNGSFTLLWHNNELVTGEQREIYETVLQA